MMTWTNKNTCWLSVIAVIIALISWLIPILISWLKRILMEYDAAGSEFIFGCDFYYLLLMVVWVPLTIFISHSIYRNKQWAWWAGIVLITVYILLALIGLLSMRHDYQLIHAIFARGDDPGGIDYMELNEYYSTYAVFSFVRFVLWFLCAMTLIAMMFIRYNSVWRKHKPAADNSAVDIP